MGRRLEDAQPPRELVELGREAGRGRRVRDREAPSHVGELGAQRLVENRRRVLLPAVGLCLLGLALLELARPEALGLGRKRGAPCLEEAVTLGTGHRAAQAQDEHHDCAGHKRHVGDEHEAERGEPHGPAHRRDEQREVEGDANDEGHRPEAGATRAAHERVELGAVLGRLGLPLPRRGHDRGPDRPPDRGGGGHEDVRRAGLGRRGRGGRLQGTRRVAGAHATDHERGPRADQRAPDDGNDDSQHGTPSTTGFLP